MPYIHRSYLLPSTWEVSTCSPCTPPALGSCHLFWGAAPPSLLPHKQPLLRERLILAMTAPRKALVPRDVLDLHGKQPHSIEEVRQGKVWRVGYERENHFLARWDTSQQLKLLGMDLSREETQWRIMQVIAWDIKSVLHHKPPGIEKMNTVVNVFNTVIYRGLNLGAEQSVTKHIGTCKVPRKSGRRERWSWWGRTWWWSSWRVGSFCSTVQSGFIGTVTSGDGWSSKERLSGSFLGAVSTPCSCQKCFQLFQQQKLLPQQLLAKSWLGLVHYPRGNWTLTTHSLSLWQRQTDCFKMRGFDWNTFEGIVSPTVFSCLPMGFCVRQTYSTHIRYSEK